jgi:hypothetical protein
LGNQHKLKTFFRKCRDEPTEIELERDVKRLIHEHADDKIKFENESPKIIGGINKIIDDVYSGRSAFKETAQAEVDEGKSKKRAQKTFIPPCGTSMYGRGSS